MKIDRHGNTLKDLIWTLIVWSIVWLIVWGAP